MYCQHSLKGTAMHPLFIAYGALALAICSEVTGSTFMQKSEQFTKLGPTIITILFFIASLFFLSQALKVLPLGVAYAIWGGLGIVLTSIVGLVVFKQHIDMYGIIGIVMIVSGVLVMNLLSKSAGH